MDLGTAHWAFLVHALSPAHRKAIGLRRAAPALVLGSRDGTGPVEGIGRICSIRLEDRAAGEVIGIPLDPQQMLEDQERALVRMERAARLAMLRAPVRAIGLGSLCAVVGGRGEALQERLEIPVTTGAAATAWAMLENARAVIGGRSLRGRPIAVIGAAGPVGRVLAALLSEEGHVVRVDSKRAAKGLRVEVIEDVDACVADCPLVLGAATTGNLVSPAALASGAIVVDVALPSILKGPAPKGVKMLLGEAVSCPREWRSGFWGPIYQVLAGYGPRQVFACLVEPLVLAVERRKEPWALGRRLEPSTVIAFGVAAGALGFQPRLAEGWRSAKL